MAFQTIIEWAAHGLEGMGIAIARRAASWRWPAFFGDWWPGMPSKPGRVLRERLARATLLGLEFLVAADIIGTVAAVPTPARLLMLTGICYCSL
jgi:hypothetical protein